MTTATPIERAGALLDRVQWHPIDGATAVCGHGIVGEHHVAVFATDPRHARGALGVRDGDALCWALRHARAERLPLVWLLDSAGAKVDEGLPALAAFRRFYREALDTRAAGVPMIALLGRGCWGGASLLAMLAQKRVFTPGTRFATSGPAIIESIEGKAKFDASDPTQVDRLLGAAARAAIDSGAVVVEEPQHAAALIHWLDEGSGMATQSHALPSGFQSPRPVVNQLSRMQTLLPPEYVATQRDYVVCAFPPNGSGKAVFCGYLAGEVVGVRECESFLRVFEEIPSRHPRCPVILTLDASGHAATIADERPILARYLDAVSNGIVTLRRLGHRVALWIPGKASGAVYVAFAAPVDHVSVLPSAKVEVLAAKAVDRILGRAVQGAASAQELVQLGIADAILDERMMGYSEK